MNDWVNCAFEEFWWNIIRSGGTSIPRAFDSSIDLLHRWLIDRNRSVYWGWCCFIVELIWWHTGMVVQCGYEMLAPALEGFFLGETRRPISFMDGSASDFFLFPDSSRIALKTGPRRFCPMSVSSSSQRLFRKTSRSCLALALDTPCIFPILQTTLVCKPCLVGISQSRRKEPASIRY